MDFTLDNKEKMKMDKQKWEKFFSYYKPYKGLFLKDMFFAILGAAITLVIPMITRYITGTVIYMDADVALKKILMLAAAMIVLVLIECYSNYYIANYGHIMGAKMEYDMRAEIFAHYQKLSFKFFDNEKVGQLMSRITNDLFDIRYYLILVVQGSHYFNMFHGLLI